MLTRKDAALMQRLGINMVRVYSVNPDLDHDLCMSIFDAIGVYVAVDVSKPVFFLGRCIFNNYEVNSPLPGESINRHNPKESYNEQYLLRIFKVVECGFSLAFHCDHNNPLTMPSIQRVHQSRILHCRQ